MSYTINPKHSFSNITVASGGSVSLPYTVGSGISISDATWGKWDTTATLNPPGGQLNLNGKDADIVINGQSLNETLQAIKDRLLIPTVVTRNPKLEAEFEELRTLGEQYQKLLEHYREQMRVFETLKKQDL